MDVELHTPTSELLSALEQATLMAKKLPTTTTDPSQILQIHTSVHHQLSLYLSQNSFSSDPMEMGDDDDDDDEGEKQNSSKGTVSNVEERMRDCCFISRGNKRVKKRPLSPSAVEQRWGFDQNGGVAAAELGDHVGSKLRSIDLIYQFHA